MSLIWKAQYLVFPTARQQIFALLILPKLIFSYLSYLNNFLNSTLKIHLPNYVTLSPVDCARNVGVICDKNLTCARHVCASKSCFFDTHDLRRTQITIDHSTACTIATSLIHYKIDFCNSLLLNLPATQINHLQLVLNSAARAITKISSYLSNSEITQLAYNQAKNSS